MANLINFSLKVIMEKEETKIHSLVNFMYKSIDRWLTFYSHLIDLNVGLVS